jgi:hypothetical protein
VGTKQLVVEYFFYNLMAMFHDNRFISMYSFQVSC